MYSITVTWLARADRSQSVYSEVKAYEVVGGLLTLALDKNHDVVIPLFDVAEIDILRHE